MSTDSPPPRAGTLSEIAEDASGFGMADLRLTRDLIVRPGAVMDAYDAHGPTAGGRYPRPLRYYIAINGLFLLLSALVGGYEGLLGTLPFDIYEAFGRDTGKERAEFLADFEQWMSLASLPIVTLVVAGPLFWAISRWSPLDWRHDLIQTITFLNAWTLYQIPFGVVMLLAPAETAAWSSLVILALAIVAYARVGKDRWWRSKGGAVGKGVLLLLIVVIMMIPASFMAAGLALMGAIYAP